jgi:hypothetical protein
MAGRNFPEFWRAIYMLCNTGFNKIWNIPTPYIILLLSHHVATPNVHLAK